MTSQTRALREAGREASSRSPADAGSSRGEPRGSRSVRLRLYGAFFAMTTIVVAAAFMSIYAFQKIEREIRVITDGGVPVAIAALDLSRKAERIVAAAPALLSADTSEEQSALAEALNRDVDALNDRLVDLSAQLQESDAVDSIRRAVRQLRETLAALDRLVTARIALRGQKRALVDAIRAAAEEMTETLDPWIAEVGDRVRDLRLDVSQAEAEGVERARLSDLVAAQDLFRRLSEARADVATLFAQAVEIAAAEDASAVQRIDVQSRFARERLSQVVDRLDDSRAERLDDLAGRLEAASAIGRTRLVELQLQAAGQVSLEENSGLASRFAAAVDRLVDSAQSDIMAASQGAERTQAVASGLLVAAAALSLVGSALIGWLYVQRNVVARLSRLSESMRAIAGGDLDARLPEPSRDEIGRMAVALAVFRDTAVEVRRSNLRELLEARRRVDDAIESIQEGFAIYDADDRLIAANSRYRELMLGDRSATLRAGAPLREVLEIAAGTGTFLGAGEDREGWIRRQIERHRDVGEPAIQRLSGDRWQMTSVRRTEQGGTVEVHSDITELQRISDELRRAKDAAEAANEAKSAFLATMSHEIRTPLNGIIGMSQLLAETRLDAEQRDFSATITQAAGTLLAIINDILDFSKVEAGALELERVPVEIEPTVAEALELVASKAAEKDLELICEIDPDVPRAIHGDPIRLKQILLNLLNNAVKFTEEGEIRISVARVDDSPGPEALGEGAETRLRFSVTDTGIGIPPDRMDRLFKSFSQIDASTTRRYGGTGLGLAITRRLVELMGGAIGAESEAGVGTTFAFTIPAQVAEIPEEAQVAVWRKRLLGKRALVVDDNWSSRTLVARKLKGWGMEVAAAAGPGEALEALAKAERPDVCVIDYLMPELDGVELGRRVRALLGEGTPPMILFSASLPSGPDFRGRVQEAGFRVVLTKPGKSRHLLKAFSEAIGGPEGEDAADGSAAPKAAPEDGLISILLVDDNAINRKVATKILKRLGHSAEQVASGEAAVRACVAKSFDVVLMDIEMPDMDGVAAAALIREKLPPETHPFIIALTANVMEAERERYLRSGMDDYLSKPIDVEALKKSLEAAAQALEARRTPAPAAPRDERRAAHG